MLDGAGRGACHGHNHIHLEPDQLSGKGGEPFEIPLGIAVFDDEVLALVIAERA
jgi:hypothetical protein